MDGIEVYLVVRNNKKGENCSEIILFNNSKLTPERNTG